MVDAMCPCGTCDGSMNSYQHASHLACHPMQASEVVETVVDAARDAQSKAQTAAAVAKTTTGAWSANGLLAARAQILMWSNC